MIKKGSMVIFVLVITLILYGCGGTEKPTADIDEDKDETTIKTEESEVTVTTNMNESIDIPEGYPEDILPIYKGLFIATAAKNLDGSFAVIGFSNDSIDDISTYYENIFKDAVVVMTSVDSENYMNMGTLKGNTYTVSAAPYVEDLGYKTSVTIILMPIGSDTDEQEDEYDSGELTVREGIIIPDNYPEDLVPFYSKDESEIAFSMKQGDRDVIGYVSTSEPQEIYDFYYNLLKNENNFKVQDLGEFAVIACEIEGINFEVGVSENSESSGEDDIYKTLVQIFYY
ncbi:MAG: hypothetical protein JW702_06015 [Clostridiales bacterium]|nr:hypothetical protein [Clostridiales bacterium]